MEITFIITTPEGIHARPATQLVNTANKFKSEISAEAKGKKVSLKSILGVLSLGLEQGETITFIVNGEDEAEAIATLQEVITKAEVGELHVRA